MQARAAREVYESSQSTFHIFVITTCIGLLVALGAAVYSWWTLRQAIGRPLDDALGHFDAIAQGDLTTSIVIRSDDEMGRLLNGLKNMQKRLAETVGSVREGALSISSATQQIAAGNTDLSQRTEEQAASLQQTAASMEEITATVKQNADSARHGSDLARDASTVAEQGSEVVGRVVDTMQQINVSSSKMADIIGVIEGIAFQTNILALNAAVEAARAGEEGRGFAVVAGEVRSLAQRSAGAAKEIKELIDESVRRVSTGADYVAEAGETMSRIIEAIRRVDGIMSEIASASHEQSEGIDQISKAVTQMDEVTQQNAALVEQAAAAAVSLEQHAMQMRDTVGVFRIDG
jgi:methyl-accepting chemotaxis protein-1 (serine sensor receptor)